MPTRCRGRQDNSRLAPTRRPESLGLLARRSRHGQSSSTPVANIQFDVRIRARRRQRSRKCCLAGAARSDNDNSTVVSEGRRHGIRYAWVWLTTCHSPAGRYRQASSERNTTNESCRRPAGTSRGLTARRGASACPSACNGLLGSAFEAGVIGRGAGVRCARASDQ